MPALFWERLTDRNPAHRASSAVKACPKSYKTHAMLASALFAADPDHANLDRVIAEAQLHGFRQMVAVIGDSANTGAIALHQAAGFRPIGTLQSVGLKLERWLDAVIMQRPLGSSDATLP